MQSQFEPYIPRKDIEHFNSGNAHRAWLSFGCIFIPRLEMYRFLLWAPNAKSVSLVGEFNAWDDKALPMEKLDGGCWVAFVSSLEEGMAYMYSITGADDVVRFKADPFARHAEISGRMASLVYKDMAYKWTDRAFLRRRAGVQASGSPMSVYEVHAGSWRKFSPDKPAYRQLGDALAEYCVDMGYTHVEFLPLTEHPFYGSWGYQVTGYFAPSSRYGSPEDFKYMVDRLHQAGIGVIMDWVPAHFPKDEYALARFDGTPLFERKNESMAEHPQWGTLIFDYASAQVRSFLISSACMFAEEYHIDGLRVDAVSSMLYLDFGRNYGNHGGKFEDGPVDVFAAAFLKKLNRALHLNYPGFISIAEESSDYRGVTASIESGGLGFDFKWDMGYMHDTLDYMSAPIEQRPAIHDKLSFSMMYAFNERYVLSYSHDEVVYGKKAMLKKMAGDYRQQLSSLRLLYAYQFAHPGKKHCFMGSEFAAMEEWNHDASLDWLLSGFVWHSRMKDYYRELNRIYTATPALYRVEDSWDGFTWLNVDEKEKSSIAFLRSSSADESYIVCACNFSAQRYDDFVIGLPAPGTLEEILSSDERRFGGSGILDKQTIKSGTKSFLNFPHSAELRLPALTAVMFRFIPGKE